MKYQTARAMRDASKQEGGLAGLGAGFAFGNHVSQTIGNNISYIRDDSFWGCFRDAEKIYYGGSKEQWEQLCTVERSEIDVKQIVYDASPDDLK